MFAPRQSIGEQKLVREESAWRTGPGEPGGPGKGISFNSRKLLSLCLNIMGLVGLCPGVMGPSKVHPCPAAVTGTWTVHIYPAALPALSPSTQESWAEAVS